MEGIFGLCISTRLVGICQCFLNLSSALQLAIVNGYSDLATDLVESGANLDLQDSNGR